MINIVVPNSYFPLSGNCISAAHADLNEGKLSIKNGEYLFSYNSFNSPLLIFNKLGIIVHSLLRDRISDDFQFRKCLNGKTMYFPVSKLLPIPISYDMDEGISELGVFDYFLKKKKSKIIADSYHIILSDCRNNIVSQKLSKPINFGIRSGISEKSLVIPENFNELGFYSEKSVWVFNDEKFSIISKYIDSDYYTVLILEENDFF